MSRTDWSPEDLAALRLGAPAQVDRMYREHARMVLAWVIRLGGPSLEAEDVAQDVFAVAVRRLPSFRGDCAVSTWLFGITRNVVSNARRRARLRQFFRLDDVPEPPDRRALPDERVELLRRRRLVQQALDTLPAHHREVLVLADFEWRTAPEVSEMLGVAVGTVYSRLHHGRKRFAQALQRAGVREKDGPLHPSPQRAP